MFLVQFLIPHLIHAFRSFFFLSSFLRHFSSLSESSIRLLKFMATPSLLISSAFCAIGYIRLPYLAGSSLFCPFHCISLVCSPFHPFLYSSPFCLDVHHFLFFFLRLPFALLFFLSSSLYNCKRYILFKKKNAP